VFLLTIMETMSTTKSGCRLTSKNCPRPWENLVRIGVSFQVHSLIEKNKIQGGITPVLKRLVLDRHLLLYLDDFLQSPFRSVQVWWSFETSDEGSLPLFSIWEEWHTGWYTGDDSHVLQVCRSGNVHWPQTHCTQYNQQTQVSVNFVTLS
jgi:hypothetical protein